MTSLGHNELIKPCAGFVFKKHKKYAWYYSHFLSHLYNFLTLKCGAGSWNPSLWNKSTYYAQSIPQEQSIKKFISASLLLHNFMKDCWDQPPSIKHHLWGAINFGLCPKYIKYKWFWHSTKEPRHQQPWYWLLCLEYYIVQLQHAPNVINIKKLLYYQFNNSY